MNMFWQGLRQTTSPNGRRGPRRPPDFCQNAAVGRRALIDRRAVVNASFELVEDGGIAAVTMQAVAERLGVSTMALYYHFADKADLMDGIVERLLFEVELPDEDLPWRERLRELAAALRASAERHPEIFSMLMQQPSTTQGAQRISDVICAALRDAGLDDPLVEQTERLLSTLVVGFATSEVSGRFDEVQAPADDDFAALQELLVDIVELRAERSARELPPA